eukprot:TRINITY_DN56269_c0_g1_i1.p2 TRINITY_DN56269_c0_g1~~TRINITY_DN56269_c0_g1_i1.p2  ORF type:complete len:413 (+),score=146.69 TRINITY_DN56269_c0_g1_i1:70-1239(+)
MLGGGRALLRRAALGACGAGCGAAAWGACSPAHASFADDAFAATQSAAGLWNRALAAADKDGDGNVSLFEAFSYGAARTEQLARDAHEAIPWDDLRQLTGQAAVAVQQLQELAVDAERLVCQVHGVLMVATRCIIEGSEAKEMEDLLQAVPGPLRRLLKEPPIQDTAAKYLERAQGDADKACELFHQDTHSNYYIATKRAMALVPGGLAIAKLADTITEIREAAFCACAFKWDVKQPKVQSQVLGCIAQVDMERVTQNAMLAKRGLDQADEAVDYVRDMTDRLDRGLSDAAEKSGALRARLYQASTGGDEVANQVARQVAVKIIEMLKGTDRDTLDFARNLFHDGPSHPPPPATFRSGSQLGGMPTWQVVATTAFWTSVLNGALCWYCR